MKNFITNINGIKNNYQTSKSPLRYPGGKSRAVKHILPYIPKGIASILSPFIGGASLELALISMNIKVVGYDNFFPLVNFWNAIIDDNMKLYENVKKYYSENDFISKDDFRKYQKSLLSINDKLESATLFYVLNRCSFSGTVLRGGMSPNHPRFRQSNIDSIKDFCIDKSMIGVSCNDFSVSIPRHSEFMYLDPPYFDIDNLYGKRDDDKFDHYKLYEIIKDRKGFIMSYNDCDEVRKLYCNFKIVNLDWTYGMNKSKKSSEVIIVSE